MKSRIICLLLSFNLITVHVRADEGMWLPQLLGKLNESQMKSLGMKISAADIYSINKGSLKDAVVSFGGFCTGDVISTQGLVLTNHHCGFDAIQNHSSLQNNYIRDGFWSKTKTEELTNKGLFVTFIVRIDDVSTEALAGTNAAMADEQRNDIISKNLARIKENVQKGKNEDSFIRGFFEGNQYYLFVTKTYRDIRLVGAPPSAIGNFGKDTDNWMWPRHTGDFSMFRIYADANNEPTEYSSANVPFKPKKSFSISLDGVKENDFTMVFGFPGRTMEYLPAVAVQQIMEVNDPAKIAIRDKALGVIDGFMRKDEAIKIQYASKYAGIQNAYKKWQGEILGLYRTDALSKKRAYETTFQQRVNANPTWKAAYGNVLPRLEELYTTYKPFGLARDYYSETTSKIELLSIASQLNSLVTAYDKDGEAGYNKRLPVVKNNLEELVGEYNVNVDRRLFEVMMEKYMTDSLNRPFVSASLNENLKTANGSYSMFAENVYNNFPYTTVPAVNSFLDGKPADVVATLKNNKAILLLNDMSKNYMTGLQPSLGKYNGQINTLQRLYMKAQMEVMTEKKFYPDANSTMRLTYGKVKGYKARDAVSYGYSTDLDGVMQKYIPGDYEFDVPEKLLQLYKKKDYGQYGSNGKMNVCFIATNHTTGGNSGSPVLDAYGNLIGLNFDRVWEGTMSDINYDPSICRNIQVDIRYVLFIVDKFAGASHLIQEMKLVHPRKN